jgi:DNA polymerase elongation subunit (family B)
LVNEGRLRKIEVPPGTLDEIGDPDLKFQEAVSEVKGLSTTLHDESLVRLTCGVPNDVGKLREYFDETWEADVLFPQRFLIDTDIRTGVEAPQTDGSPTKVHVDDLEPLDEDEVPDVKPRMVVLDIEVKSEGGVPDTELVEQPVTAISAYDNYDDEYREWVLEHEEWGERPDFDENLPDGMKDVQVDVYSNETTMLDEFHEYVINRRVDLLSGWNADGFDFPYLINRSNEINAHNVHDWSPLGQTFTTKSNTPVVKGIELFDMLEAYEETQFHEKKSYSLEYIANDELGFGKEDVADIDEAWMHDPAQFVKYNLRDSEAVVEIERSQQIINQYDHYREVTGQLYTECHHAISLIDMLFLRDARDANVALPTSVKPDVDHYHGAKVFPPEPGKHKNVFYPDLASLYPNLFYATNMSPETLVGTEEELSESEYTKEDCFRVFFDPREDEVKDESDDDPEEHEIPIYVLKPDVQKAFVRSSIQSLIDMKYEYKGTDKYEAVKRVTNAVYGVMGDKDTYGRGFRLFNVKIAEGITLAGRKVLEHTAETIVDWLQNNGYPDTVLIGGDTDSAMLSSPSMNVNPYELEAAARGHTTHPVFEAAKYTNQTYDEFMEKNIWIDKDHRMEVEIESYADACFFLYDFDEDDGTGVKKRYSQLITWDEDDGVIKSPDPKTKGFELVRSDSSTITGWAQEEVLRLVLERDDAKDAVFTFLESLTDSMKKGDLEKLSEVYGGELDLNDVGIPSAISGRPLHEYGTDDETGELTKTPNPHIRGAKYANQNFDGEDISQGDKPLLFKVDRVASGYPETYTAETLEDDDVVDAIAVNDVRNIPDRFKLNWEGTKNDKGMIEKTVKSPIEPIIKTMGWTWNDVMSTGRQSGLAAFA